MVYTTGGISLLFGGFTQFGMTSVLCISTTAAPATGLSSRLSYLLVLSNAGVRQRCRQPSCLVGINSTFQGDTDTWEYASGTWTQVNFGTPNPYPTEEGASLFITHLRHLLHAGGANGPAVSGSGMDRSRV